MVTEAEIFDNIFEDAGLTARPANPAMPAKGARKTYLITFDNGIGDTEGMLDCLREAGEFAISYGRFPRTTIVCRTAAAARAQPILSLIADNLFSNGSAMVVLRGTSDAWFWPKRPWKKDAEKSWAKIEP
jgi:hypothetical protein